MLTSIQDIAAVLDQAQDDLSGVVRKEIPFNTIYAQTELVSSAFFLSDTRVTIRT